MLNSLYVRIGITCLLVFSVANRLCFGLKCYTGVSHKKSLDEHFNDLTEVQCSRTYQHQQTYVQHDGGVASTSQINVSYSLQNPNTEGDVNSEFTNCIIFYNPATDVADFACDHDNICADATSTKQTSMCHKGVRGSLFCCQGDLCNLESYTRRLSPPQASTVCYNGSNSGTVEINEIGCMSSWCYQSATFINGRILEQKFGCEDRCTEPEFELNGATCREVYLHGGVHQRICYCSVDRCNSQIHPITSGSSDTEPGRFPQTLPPYLKMYHDTDDDQGLGAHRTKKRWIMLGGWISAGTLGLLFLSLVAMLIHRCRQQQASRKESFAYAQLTNESADQEQPLCEKAVVA